MSGHNKWQQIKRQKGVADIKRGQLFTKIGRLISIAVKEGGGSSDPENNFKLRLAIEKARQINMPKENVRRAIERAAGKGSGGIQLEQVIYEGYGPFGIAILIEVVTDNKQRSASVIKHLLDSHNGHLANPGSVSYLFERAGFITILKNSLSEDELLEAILEAGATNYEKKDNYYEVYTNPASLHQIKEKLAKLNLKVESSELIFQPKNMIAITEKDKADKLVNLLEALEELDDVQKVYANFDLPESYVQ